MTKSKDATAKLRQQFEDQFLPKLGAPRSGDVTRVESLFGRQLSGPLRQLIDRRGIKKGIEIGPFMVFRNQDGYPRDDESFEQAPFESVLREMWLLQACFADCIPIGRDGGGQMYFAHLGDSPEIALYDPGQGAVRFLAADLPTFVYLAQLGEEVWDLIDKLELDDPGDADPGDPALQPLTSKLALIADRINLCDEVVTSDFDEPLTQMTRLEPAHRPEPSAIEEHHDRAHWLLLVLGMGYDTWPVHELNDTFDEERGDPEKWSSPAVRLYWLWCAFVLGEDDRLDDLLETLADDDALLVRDSVRLVRSLKGVTEPDEVPENLRDLVRSRNAFSLLWQRHLNPMRLELPAPDEQGLAPEHIRRTAFLTNKGYARGNSLYTEEARETIAALHHGDAALFTGLVPLLDRPPTGGDPDSSSNPIGAGLLPFDTAPTCRATLLEALPYRSTDLSHVHILPGVIRALGRLGATECVPELLQLFDEFAVVWEFGYAKAGSPAVLEALCEALAQLEDDRGIGKLVALAGQEADTDGALLLRHQAIVALAHTGFEPTDEQINDWTGGKEREAAQYLLARRGRSLPIDETLVPLPSTAFSFLCRAVAEDRAADALEAAELALQTVHKHPFVTRLMHTVALQVIQESAPAERATEIFTRMVRFTLVEEVRRRAIELLRAKDPSFKATFCDRPSVDAAFDQDGAAGLVALLEAPCPVYRHNVFTKAAEEGEGAAVVEYLPAFADDLASYRHLWGGALADPFETQYYTAIRALHTLGEHHAGTAVNRLWGAGPIGRERVEYVLKNLGIKAFDRFEERRSRINELEQKGGQAYSSQQYKKAQAHFNDLLELNPGIAPVWRNLGFAQLQANQPEQALASFQRATELEPNHAMGWYWVSQALYHLERWEELISAARQGLVADPNCLRCRFNQALALAEMNRNQEALNEYNGLLENDLSSESWMVANLHLNCAICYVAMDREAEAIDALRASLAADAAYLDYALAEKDLVKALGEQRIRECL